MITYRPATESYDDVVQSDPRRTISVEVGDSKDASRFQPQFKTLHWNNEANFSMRLLGGAGPASRSLSALVAGGGSRSVSASTRRPSDGAQVRK